MKRRAWVGTAGFATALVAVGMMGGGLAMAGGAARGGHKPTRIRMEASKKDLFFKGPSTIERGTDLQIVNDSNPRKVGPHTFTVVKRKFLPGSKQEMKQCEKGKGVCGQVAAAHQYDPATNKVNRPTVEVGKSGWDKAFTDKKIGDSWYTEKKGAKQTRTVKAKAGTKLFYVCVVHPFMQGKIKVVK